MIRFLLKDIDFKALHEAMNYDSLYYVVIKAEAGKSYISDYFGEYGKGVRKKMFSVRKGSNSWETRRNVLRYASAVCKSKVREMVGENCEIIEPDFTLPNPRSEVYPIKMYFVERVKMLSKFNFDYCYKAIEKERKEAERKVRKSQREALKEAMSIAFGVYYDGTKSYAWNAEYVTERSGFYFSKGMIARYAKRREEIRDRLRALNISEMNSEPAKTDEMEKEEVTEKEVDNTLKYTMGIAFGKYYDETRTYAWNAEYISEKSGLYFSQSTIARLAKKRKAILSEIN